MAGRMKLRTYFKVLILICGLCIGIYTFTLFEKHIPTFDSRRERQNHEGKKNTNEGSIRETVTHNEMNDAIIRNQQKSPNASFLKSQSRSPTISFQDSWPKSTNIILPKDGRYMAYNLTSEMKSSAQKKLIVMFNRPGWLFGDDRFYERVFDICPYKCNITDDRSQMPKADALWVDLCRLQNPTPPRHPPHQMWVAYFIESPVHCWGYHGYPAWRSVFNRTFGYRTDSDFFRPYGDFLLRTEPARKNYTDIMLHKTKPVAWFVSNCGSSSRREQYVAEMKKYIGIDVYGNCGTFKCPGLTEEKCFRLLNTTYYFYLAFENSYCQDYVTEKLFKTYRNLNIIPVVRGGAKYSLYLPPNTYLDAANFSSPKQLAYHLLALMKDVDTYTAMLRTKDHFYTSFRSWVRPNLKPFCEMCQMLQVSPPPRKEYPDIVDWGEKNKCWSARDV